MLKTTGKSLIKKYITHNNLLGLNHAASYIRSYIYSYILLGIILLQSYENWGCTVTKVLSLIADAKQKIKDATLFSGSKSFSYLGSLLRLYPSI